MVELGINIEDNEQIDENKDSSSQEQVNEDQSLSSSENEESNSKEESIESIPFIAEPSKDKRTRSSK